jgi:hypothetical protein
LGGAFKSTHLPIDYMKLEEFLSNQSSFSRTLWIPNVQRFGYYSNNHPYISGQELFKIYNPQKLTAKINESVSHLKLREMGVKYLIVPYDTNSEIFLTDRKYDDKVYKKTIENLRKNSFLKEKTGFGKIAVFEINGARDHFWSPNQNLEVSYEYINPSKYRVNVKNAKKGNILVFSENYNRGWVAEENNKKVIKSKKSYNGLNSFELSEDGSYILNIEYKPQIWVNIGLAISGATIIICISLLAWLYKKK